MAEIALLIGSGTVVSHKWINGDSETGAGTEFGGGDIPSLADLGNSSSIGIHCQHQPRNGENDETASFKTAHHAHITHDFTLAMPVFKTAVKKRFAGSTKISFPIMAKDQNT